MKSKKWKKKESKMRNMRMVLVMMVLFVQMMAKEVWYVDQKDYTGGFCVPAYVAENGGIILLNMNYISLDGSPLVLLDEDMFIPKVEESEDGWKIVFIDGTINAEIFRWMLSSHKILPYEDLVFRDDLQKVIIIFKEVEDERDTFQLKVVPTVEGKGNYSLEEIEEEDFSQRIVSVEGDEPIPIFVRK